MPATFAQTVRLPIALKEQLEQAAAYRGESQNDIIIKAIEHELDGTAHAAAVERELGAVPGE